MLFKEILSQLSLLIVNLYLKSYSFLYIFLSYIYICGSGSGFTKLLNTDPIWIRMHNTDFYTSFQPDMFRLCTEWSRPGAWGSGTWVCDHFDSLQELSIIYLCLYLRNLWSIIRGGHSWLFSNQRHPPPPHTQFDRYLVVVVEVKSNQKHIVRA